MITLEHVTVRYRENSTPVLSAVDLHVPSHKTMSLLGGSGSGKSTMLKAILRLLPLQSGRILIDGKDSSMMDPIALRRKIGMVFQGNALFPHMTVEENIGLILKLSGTKPALIRTRVEELMYRVSLAPEEYASRYPHQISGGQQQRVSVARALSTSPSYLLMDEPFGALDAITRRTLQEEVKTLCKTLGVTMLFVTHDVIEAVYMGDYLGVMEHGSIVQSGVVRSVIETPISECVYRLVQKPLSELSYAVRESAV